MKDGIRPLFLQIIIGHLHLFYEKGKSDFSFLTDFRECFD